MPDIGQVGDVAGVLWAVADKAARPCADETFINAGARWSKPTVSEPARATEKVQHDTQKFAKQRYGDNGLSTLALAQSSEYGPEQILLSPESESSQRKGLRPNR
jgi:hypothetical protein